MNIRIITSIFLFTLSTSLFSQNSRIILGSWIKTKMEAFDKKSDPFIEKRDEKFIKYTFENNGQMYISSVYNEKGNEIKYTIQNNIVDLLFNKFKIEKIDNKQLILIELNNNKISPSSTRIFFNREQVYLDGLTLDEKDIIKEEQDYLYIENQKVYPKFRNKDNADVKSFIQPFVEERSNGKEHLSYSTFVINTDGKVSDIKIHHHINKSYDKNLKKAISKTNGMWISPIVNGKKVKVLKEISFHYIVFPDLKNVNGKIEVNKKTSDITKSYESLFKQATKEYLRGNLESALKTYSKSIDLTSNNINISIQKNIIYKKLNDSLNFDKTKEKIQSSKFNYVLKK
ncbi:hypothetical protein [Aquimarina sp. Aq78]|uniref:hypothetical protein n=1 Tax=Aquimarina sp. Aq78 TaxID=1191889 RepID=UPI000D108B28|nr:hypothetical protein [Aquimarina sp. Aq78]